MYTYIPLLLTLPPFTPHPTLHPQASRLRSTLLLDISNEWVRACGTNVKWRYHLAIKEHSWVICIVMWMDPESVIQREISQKRKT